MSTNYDLNAMTYDEDVKDDVTCIESGTQTPSKSDDTARSEVSVPGPVHYRVYKKRWLGLIGFVSLILDLSLRGDAHESIRSC